MKQHHDNDYDTYNATLGTILEKIRTKEQQNASQMTTTSSSSSHLPEWLQSAEFVNLLETIASQYHCLHNNDTTPLPSSSTRTHHPLRTHPSELPRRTLAPNLPSLLNLLHHIMVLLHGYESFVPLHATVYLCLIWYKISQQMEMPKGGAEYGASFSSSGSSNNRNQDDFFNKSHQRHLPVMTTTTPSHHDALTMMKILKKTPNKQKVFKLMQPYPIESYHIIDSGNSFLLNDVGFRHSRQWEERILQDSEGRVSAGRVSFNSAGITTHTTPTDTTDGITPAAGNRYLIHWRRVSDLVLRPSLFGTEREADDETNNNNNTIDNTNFTQQRTPRESSPLLHYTDLRYNLENKILHTILSALLLHIPEEKFRRLYFLRLYEPNHHVSLSLFNMKRDARRVQVICDDLVPCIPFHQPIGVYSVKENQVWVWLLQKAVSRCLGGYEAMWKASLSQLMPLFTGREPVRIDFTVWELLYFHFNHEKDIILLGGGGGGSRDRNSAPSAVIVKIVEHEKKLFVYETRKNKHSWVLHEEAKKKVSQCWAISMRNL